MLIVILSLIRRIVRTFLVLLEVALFLRAILSWFIRPGNKFTDFLYSVTEPFLVPWRMLFRRFGWFEGFPLDMTFTFTYLTVILLQVILP